MKLLAIAVVSALLTTGPVAGSARYLESRQTEGGGFAEPGRAADPATTAWAALGLRAAGGSPDALARARTALAQAATASQTDRALNALARAALGERLEDELARLRAYRPTKLVNATIWTVLALRQAGEPVPTVLVRELRAAQRPNGGWSWLRGGAPDSNDTAAAIQALRSAGVSGAPIERGLAYLRRLQNVDGGFGLTSDRPSDSQSTAWAIQAFLSAGMKPGASAWRFLSRMRRSDGSYRYSARHPLTPVWVTAQVLPALAGKPFPLRSA